MSDLKCKSSHTLSMGKVFINQKDKIYALENLDQNGLIQVSDQKINFSVWLSDQLSSQLKTMSHWSEIGIISLGSWSRQELCPASDIDLLLIGNESKIKVFVNQCMELGLRIRYRTPLNLQNWNEGVESFDILSLFKATGVNELGKSELEKQKNNQKLSSKLKKEIFRSLKSEKINRHKRYNSISNYLEPNLKYGPGGLRDLNQAKYVIELFPNKFKNQVTNHSIQVFEEYNQFFLKIRYFLHLINGSDQIRSGDQIEISNKLGFSDLKEFMKQVQLGLSRVNFYSDWVFSQGESQLKHINMVNEIEINSLKSAFDALNLKKSYLIQGHIRANADKLIALKVNKSTIGKYLLKSLSVEKDEFYLRGLFRSRLLEVCVPELKRVSGVVQHDQYHRYTVDAHIQQTVINVQRFYQKKWKFPKISLLLNQLNLNDWKILIWTALYHDLAKDRGGNHSVKGAQLAKQDLIKFKCPLRLTVEVAWMVERHLDVSKAAFKLNPHSAETWKWLHERGIVGQRLKRLVVFTAIDIISTNPDAWSDWKEKLLMELYDSCTQKSGGRFSKLLNYINKSRIKVDNDFIMELDPSLLESIPVRILAEEALILKKNKSKSLVPLLWSPKKGEYWIRFHHPVDRDGLFYDWVKVLFGAGCRVLQASVKTFDKFGAYDWFLVKSNKNMRQLKIILNKIDGSAVKNSNVYFDKLKIVSRDDKEAIISLKTEDKPGLLVSAASGFSNVGLNIKWAKVFTWGKQIDDIFGVEIGNQQEFDDKIKNLEELILKK